jgi:hypothetical protein
MHESRYPREAAQQPLQPTSGGWISPNSNWREHRSRLSDRALDRHRKTNTQHEGQV